MNVTRRDVLKGLAAAGVGAGLPMTGISRAVFGAEAGAAEPILVMLHLRGACDGLNLVSPATDPDFIAARASDLRVLADGAGAGFALDNGPAPNIDFRLHPAAAGFSELYKSKKLAFIHACGLTDGTRSHFVATDMIERGVGTETDLQRVEKGWIARSLFADDTGRRIGAVAASGLIPGDLDGMAGALAIPNLNGGLPLIGGAGVSNALWMMYAKEPGPVGEAGRLALRLPAEIDARIPRDAGGKLVAYQAAPGVNYDAAADLGGSFKTLAQLIRMDIGLRAVTLDYGGWDTHEYQPNRFRPLVERLSSGVAAFWNDMAPYHDRIVLVGLTEFGRRLRSNASNGTDHGRGSLAFVLGRKVKGGKFHGAWPGLNSSQLDEGVDLAVATDYRRVLADVLESLRPGTGRTAFPNYAYQGPLGIFSA